MHFVVGWHGRGWWCRFQRGHFSGEGQMILHRPIPSNLMKSIQSRDTAGVGSGACDSSGIRGIPTEGEVSPTQGCGCGRERARRVRTLGRPP
jgi:hypothetical protein